MYSRRVAKENNAYTYILSRTFPTKFSQTFRTTTFSDHLKVMSLRTNSSMDFRKIAFPRIYLNSSLEKILLIDLLGTYISVTNDILPRKGFESLACIP